MARSMAHYVVIGHYSNGHLADEVNWYLANGYELAGPLCASPGYVRQAVVRSAPPKVTDSASKNPLLHPDSRRVNSDVSKVVHSDPEIVVTDKSADPAAGKIPSATKHIQYKPGMNPPVNLLAKAKRVSSPGESVGPVPTKTNTYKHPVTSKGKNDNWLNLTATYRHIDSRSNNPAVKIKYTDHTTREIIYHMEELANLGYETEDLNDVLNEFRQDQIRMSKSSESSEMQPKPTLSRIADGMMQRSALWQLLNNPDDTPDLGTQGRS